MPVSFVWHPFLVEAVNSGVSEEACARSSAGTWVIAHLHQRRHERAALNYSQIATLAPGNSSTRLKVYIYENLSNVLKHVNLCFVYFFP